MLEVYALIRLFVYSFACFVSCCVCVFFRITFIHFAGRLNFSHFFFKRGKHTPVKHNISDSHKFKVNFHSLAYHCRFASLPARTLYLSFHLFRCVCVYSMYSYYLALTQSTVLLGHNNLIVSRLILIIFRRENKKSCFFLLLLFLCLCECARSQTITITI